MRWAAYSVRYPPVLRTATAARTTDGCEFRLSICTAFCGNAGIHERGPLERLGGGQLSSHVCVHVDVKRVSTASVANLR